jgi:hypothetical protein
MLSEPRPAACDAVADDLAAVDEQHVLSPTVGAHVESCLRCQAEVASYRRMRRTLRSLAEHPVIVSPRLEGEILTVLDTVDGRPSVRVPVAAAATIGGLAAAAGVIAFAARHRRVLRLAS